MKLTMKTLVSAITLTALSVSSAYADMAIDGKDYEKTPCNHK